MKSKIDYLDENKTIPKNTSILVKRIPKNAASSRFQPYEARRPHHTPMSNPSGASFATGLEAIGKSEDEAARIQAMARTAASQFHQQLDLQETFS
jgi:hypothetical protein